MFKGELEGKVEGDLKGDLKGDFEVYLEGDFRGDFKQDLEGTSDAGCGSRLYRLLQTLHPLEYTLQPDRITEFSWCHILPHNRYCCRVLLASLVYYLSHSGKFIKVRFGSEYMYVKDVRHLLELTPRCGMCRVEPSVPGPGP